MCAEESSFFAFTPQKGKSDAAIYCNFQIIFLNKKSNFLFSALKIMLSGCGMYLIHQKIQR
jgi:hypothetical protein